MQKKKLILVASPPACGKNFVSERIAQECGHIVYLDKDDLCDLVGCTFDLCGQERNMDSKFYSENIRASEYSTIIRIALSALRYEDTVLVNAPFGKEVRDSGYMAYMKNTVNKMGAELALVWVIAPSETCYERMKKRNAIRDLWKLENWKEYVKNINYSTPIQLLESQAVDKLIEFNNGNAMDFSSSLKEVIRYICEV